MGSFQGYSILDDKFCKFLSVLVMLYWFLCAAVLFTTVFTQWAVSLQPEGKHGLAIEVYGNEISNTQEFEVVAFDVKREQ